MKKQQPEFHILEASDCAFSQTHPLVNFLFYAFVIVFTVLVTHPVFLAVSFIFAFTFSVIVQGKQALRFFFCFALPLIAVFTAINPLLVHKGGTILYYIEDNPVTAEAYLYGFVGGLMLATVLMWFATASRVVTSDKFVYLFGRIIPWLALILSMALRLIPKMLRQLKVISSAQAMIGKGMRGGGLIKKIKHGLRILSILITWSLENGIETSDSMKARGYGLKHRTSFTLYRFYKRDKLLLPTVICLAAVCIVGAIFDVTYFQYYPYFILRTADVYGAVVMAAFAAVCALPILIEIIKGISWRYSKSKI